MIVYVGVSAVKREEETALPWREKINQQGRRQWRRLF